MTPLELAANLLTTISILLAGRNHVQTWWTGIVGCALFAVLFYQSKLYADVALQLFFMGTSVLGWIRWRGGTAQPPVAVSHASRQQVVAACALGLLVTTVYGGLLHRFTDAFAPFADSAVLGFSVMGQWLLIKRRVESWPLWLLVNLIAVPLFASRELYLTAVLYAAYLVNALIAWWHWQQLARQTAAAAASSPAAA
ncbi:MAG: nicotinamide riboside transporter PnuC [Rhodoferax sp.]